MQGLTSRRSPGRCPWSARRRPWGWCSWCSCTEATSSGWHTGSSCEQIHWWTVQRRYNNRVQILNITRNHITERYIKKKPKRHKYLITNTVYNYGIEFHVNESINKPILTSSVLYIPNPQPPAGKSYTSHSFCLPPSAGENTILNLPGWLTTKSVALYCEIKHQTCYVRLLFYSAWMHLWNEQTRICISYLIAKSMSADCYGLCPTGNEARDVFTEDWLAENCAAQDVPDGSIGTLPHLLQLKLWKYVDIL